MKREFYSIITASGSYIPENIIKNEEFVNQEFYETDGKRINRKGEEIVEKLKEITEIEERRYANKEHLASDLASFAAQNAIDSINADKESFDYIIVTHNFGDMRDDNRQVDMVPTLASKVKHNLGIKNPDTVAYDLPFGCPGWVQGFIQADYYIRSGDAKRILVIAAETLSRISDVYDRDGMIFSDGAGAVIVEATQSEDAVGILAHKSRTDALDYAYLLKMDKSNNPDIDPKQLFIKMNGRKLYVYAISTVPPLVKATIEKAGLDISDIDKVLIHQANAKMDYAMLNRLFDLYNVKDTPKDIMPMTISKLGNSSVATIPTMYDLIMRGKLKGQEIKSGQNIIFVSVGAGMNANAVVYRVP